MTRLSLILAIISVIENIIVNKYFIIDKYISLGEVYVLILICSRSLLTTLDTNLNA